MDIKPKWVVFDVGGVLLDWTGGLKKTAEYLKIDQKHLLNIFFKYSDAMELGQISPVVGWNKVLKDLHKNPEGKNIVKIWLSGCRWVESNMRLVKELKKAGYSLAVFSNNWIGIQKSFWRKRTEFFLFNIIIDSSIIHKRKPDIKIFQILEREMNARGKMIFYIEDSLENIKVARTLGWQTFNFNAGTDNEMETYYQIRQKLLNRVGE